VQDNDLEPTDPEACFAGLCERSIADELTGGAVNEVQSRLIAVAECRARVVMRIGSTGDTTRNYYVADETAVAYERNDDGHLFGVPNTEAELAGELASTFTSTHTIRARPLSMSAGDYLVFAVFARDLRSQPAAATGDDDAPMSIDEVLSYFDEPEDEPRPQSDQSWQRSVDILCKEGVLVATRDGYELHPSLHAVAREIVADHQHTVVRFDFLDVHWLVREVSLYPTRETVYRLGTRADGSVVIEELSTRGLTQAIADIVGTLPDILTPDVPPTLRGATISTRGGF
jgi:hypothetical protein